MWMRQSPRDCMRVRVEALGHSLHVLDVLADEGRVEFSQALFKVRDDVRPAGLPGENAQITSTLEHSSLGVTARASALFNGGSRHVVNRFNTLGDDGASHRPATPECRFLRPHRPAF